MAVHHGPIQERILWLQDLANRHTAEFRSPEASLARDRYRASHPTDIVVLKCMDGRINIPVATGTPPGIITPIRNLGGMFDLGWPHLGEVLAHHVQQVVNDGHQVLMLITYHFSRGEVNRGCAGFDYDTSAAVAHTRAIKQQAEEIFGAGHGTVYPVICGFETDEDALLLHGADNQVLDLSALAGTADPDLEGRVAALFPDMPGRIKTDLLPLLYGNHQWISRVRARPRQLDIEHREWMICLGRGFDFLHTPNLALIVGPYSPDLSDPVRQAAGIIEANMRAGRIPDDGFLLLTSAPYDDIGMDRARAALKSRFLSRFGAEVIKTHFPSLAERMHIQTAVLSWRSRGLSFLSQESAFRIQDSE